MATGKKLYYRITRDVLHVSDREGGGTRLLYDAPRIAARLKAHPQVREAVVVAFPDRRVGTGLYAFVEGDPGLTERGLREFLAAETAAKTAPKSPEHLQVTGQLPRGVSGEVRSEILELVAMNQVDLIDSLIASDDERALVAHRRRSPQPTRPICVLTEDPPRPPRRAPDDQLSPPGRDRNRHEWIVAAPLHAGERRPRERDRQKRGHDGRRGGREQLLRRAEMAASARSQFSQCREQLRCRRRALGLLPVGSVPRQDFKRDIELAARGMDRKRREQPGKRMGKAGVMAQRADIRLAAGSEDLRREHDEARGGAVRVGFEVAKRRHRLVVEIEPARIDERLERLRRQPVARD